MVITEIVKFGGPERESQQVIVDHNCPVLGRIVHLTVSFPSILSLTKRTQCPNCQEEVEIIKKSGAIQA